MSNKLKKFSKLAAIFLLAIVLLIGSTLIFLFGKEASFDAASTYSSFDEVENGQNIVIGGSYAFGKYEPLRIVINRDRDSNNGVMPYFYQDIGGTNQYVQKYSGKQGSGIVLSFDNGGVTYKYHSGYANMMPQGGAASSMELKKTYVSADKRTVRRVFACGVFFNVTIDVTYNPFTTYFDTKVKLENLGIEASNVKVFYGGSLNLRSGGADENTNGYYDAGSGSVYLVHNPINRAVGSMWLKPDSGSPFSAYFVGEDQMGTTLVKNNRLNSQVAAGAINDESYYAQWDLGSINNVGTASLSFSEHIKAAGFLQISGDGTHTASAGSKVIMEFMLHQRKYTADYKLSASSKQGYLVELLSEDTITLAPESGGDVTAKVTLQVTVPNVVAKPVTDEVTLNADCLSVAPTDNGDGTMTDNSALINSVYMNALSSGCIDVNGSRPNLQDIKIEFDYTNDKVTAAELSFVPLNIMVGTNITGDILSSTHMSLDKKVTVRSEELNGRVKILFENIDLPIGARYFFDVRIDGYEELEDKIAFSDVPVTQIVINDSISELYTGNGSFTFTGTAYPTAAIRNKMRYTSSNQNVAVIDAESGVMTPKAAGVTTIKLSSVEDPSVYSETVVTVHQGVESDSMSIVPTANNKIAAGKSHKFDVVFNQPVQPEDKTVTYSLVLGSNSDVELSVDGTMYIPIKTPVGSEFIVRATSVTNPNAYADYRFAVTVNEQLSSVLSRLEQLPQVISNVKISEEEKISTLRDDIMALKPADVAEMVTQAQHEHVSALLAEISRQREIAGAWIVTFNNVPETEDGLIAYKSSVDELIADMGAFNESMIEYVLLVTKAANMEYFSSVLSSRASSIRKLEGEVKAITDGVAALYDEIPKDESGNIIKVEILKFAARAEELYALCTEYTYTNEQKRLFRESYDTLLTVTSLIDDVNLLISKYTRRYNSLSLYLNDEFQMDGCLAKRVAVGTLLADITSDTVVPQDKMADILAKLTYAQAQISALISEYTDISTAISALDTSSNKLIGQHDEIERLASAVQNLTNEQRSYIIDEINLLYSLRAAMNDLLQAVERQKDEADAAMDAIDASKQYIARRQDMADLKTKMTSDVYFNNEQITLLQSQIDRINALIDTSYLMSAQLDAAEAEFDALGLFKLDAWGNVVIENDQKVIDTDGIVIKKSILDEFIARLNSGFTYNGAPVVWTDEQNLQLNTRIRADISRLNATIEEIILRMEETRAYIIDHTNALIAKVDAKEIDLITGSGILGWVFDPTTVSGTYENYNEAKKILTMFGNLIIDETTGGLLIDMKRFLTEFVLIAERCKEQIDILIRDNERRLLAGNTIAYTEELYLTKQLYAVTHGAYNSEQMKIIEDLGILKLMQAYDKQYATYRDTFAKKVQEYTNFANGLFIGEAVKMDVVFQYRKLIMKYIDEMNGFPATDKNNVKYIAAYTKMSKLNDAVSSIWNDLMVFKEPIDRIGILVKNTEEDYVFSYDGNKRVYVFNSENYNGLIGMKTEMFVQYNILKNTWGLAHDVEQKTIMRNIMSAYEAIFEKIDELIAAAALQNDVLRDEFFALELWETDGSGNILTDENDELKIDKNIIYDVSVKRRIESVMAKFTGLTEEQKYTTEIGLEAARIFDFIGGMGDEIIAYLNKIYALGIWQLDVNGSPILDANNHFIIIRDGLISAYEKQLPQLLAMSSGFTEQQRADIKMVKAFEQVQLLEPVYTSLKADIQQVIEQVTNLGAIDANGNVILEGLIAKQAAADSIKNIISRTAPLHADRYLTAEQSTELAGELHKLQQIDECIIALENAISNFVTLYGNFNASLASSTDNLYPVRDEINELYGIYMSFTAEQKSVGAVIAAISGINGYLTVLENRDREYETLINRYNQLDLADEGLIARESDVIALYKEMQQFRQHEASVLRNELSALNALLRRINDLRSEIATFETMAGKISSDRKTMISKHMLLENAFAYYNAMTDEQKALALSVKEVLDGYERIYQELLAEIAVIESRFGALPIFDENGVLDLAAVMLHSKDTITNVNGEEVTLRAETDAILEAIEALVYEQKNRVISVIRVVNDVDKYLDEIASVEALKSEYNVLLGNINKDKSFYGQLEALRELLIAMESTNAWQKALLRGEITDLTTFIAEASDLLVTVNTARNDFLLLDRDNYRDTVIENRSRIENLYSRLVTSKSLTTEQQSDLAYEIRGITAMYNALTSCLATIDGIRSDYNELLSEVDGKNGLLGISVRLRAILTRIMTEDPTKKLTDEQFNSVVDIKTRIEHNLAEVDQLIAEVDAIVEEIDSKVHTGDEGLIGDKILIESMITEINSKTAEQIGMLKEYNTGKIKVNYIAYIESRLARLSELVKMVDDLRQKILPLSDEDDGLIAHADVVTEVCLQITEVTAEQRSMLTDTALKANAMLEAISRLTKQLNDVKAQIDALPSVNEVAITDKQAVTSAFDAFKRLTAEQKQLLGSDYQTKVAALTVQISILEMGGNSNAGIEVGVSEEDLSNNVVVTVDEIDPTSHTYSLYYDQIKFNFNSNMTERIYRLSSNYVGGEPLKNMFTVSISADSPDYYVVKIKSDGTLQRLDAKYEDGKFVFSTRDIVTYALVSTRSEFNQLVIVYASLVGIVLIIFAIVMILRAVPAFKLVREGDVVRFKIRRMSSKIKNYRFYANGYAVDGDSIVSLGAIRVSLCYSYKRMFYYADTLDEMSHGYHKKTKALKENEARATARAQY